MSGRDLRTFLVDHRQQTFKFTGNDDKLLSKYVAGAVAGPQFKAVDYGRLLAEAKGRREEGKRGRRRVDALRRKGRETREGGMVRKHREVWERERNRLRDVWKSAVTDLELWRSNILLAGPDGLKPFLSALTEYETALWEERRRFESETVDPIWSLRIDLKGWVEGGGRGGAGLSREEREGIREQLVAVKDQQRRIQNALKEECDLLTADLEEWAESYLPTNEPVITRGIPTELAGLDWPDHALRDAIMEEFHLLDDRYQATLDQLEREYGTVISSLSGGWTVDDAQRFSAIVAQYPPSMANHRALYVDRLQRELPHKTRREIVDHESWYTATRYYHTRRKAYLRSWAGQRAELVRRVEGVYRESVRAREVKEGERGERERHSHHCRQLAEKVSRWRQERLEAMRIEAELAARVRESEEERRLEEEEKERAVREKQREKLQLYHAEIERRHLLEREREKLRLSEAQRKQQEQDKIDKARVQYRAVLQSQREQQRRVEEEREEGERREREQRLETLRQQVRVEAPVDPLRILRETQASLARALSHQETVLELQQPLFPLHGYSDKAVTSDTRFKVAAALRNAGLHETDYARRVFASIPPSLPPRPDQKSTIFK